MDMWKFDVSTQNWKRIIQQQPCPRPRFLHAAALDPNGRYMYIHGGLFLNSSSSHHQLIASDELWRWELASENPTWEQLGDDMSKSFAKPSPRFDHAITIVEDDLFVLYGKRDARVYASDLVWAFNISDSNWIERTSDQAHIPQPRSGMTAVTMKPWDFRQPFQNNCDVICNKHPPSQQTYDMFFGSELTAMPSFNQVKSKKHKYFVMFFGGETELTSSLGTPYKDSWLYWPDQHFWLQTSSQSFPTTRFNHAGTVVRTQTPQGSIVNICVIFGGFNDINGFLNDIWVLAFDPSVPTNKARLVWTHIIPKDRNAPSPRSGHSLITVIPFAPSHTLEQQSLHRKNMVNITLIGDSSMPLTNSEQIADATNPVLIMHGGRESLSHFSPLADTFLFDLESERWFPVNNTGDVIPRTYHAAVTLNSISMLVYGGQGFGNASVIYSGEQVPNSSSSCAKKQRLEKIFDHQLKLEKNESVAILKKYQEAVCEEDQELVCNWFYSEPSPGPTTECACRPRMQNNEHKNENEHISDKSEPYDYTLLGDVSICEYQDKVCVWRHLPYRGQIQLATDQVINAVHLPTGGYAPKARSHHSGNLISIIEQQYPTLVIFGGIIGPVHIPSDAAGMCNFVIVLCFIMLYVTKILSF